MDNKDFEKNSIDDILKDFRLKGTAGKKAINVP